MVRKWSGTSLLLLRAACGGALSASRPRRRIYTPGSAVGRKSLQRQRTSCLLVPDLLDLVSLWVLVDPCTLLTTDPSELAGELRDFHPGVNVTIVQSSDKALNAHYDDRYRDRVTSEIQ